MKVTPAGKGPRETRLAAKLRTMSDDIRLLKQRRHHEAPPAPSGETTHFAYYDNHVTDDPEMSVDLVHPAIPDSIFVFLNGLLQRFDWDYSHDAFDDDGMVTRVTLYSDMEAEDGDLLEIRYAYR